MSGIIANIGGERDEPLRAAVGNTYTGAGRAQSLTLWWAWASRRPKHAMSP